MIEILEEREAFVAVAKPSGLPVVPTREDPEGPTLQRALQAQIGERLLVVHRLDRETSGVLLLARTPEAHRRLCGLFARREVEKVYLALCRRARADAPTAGKVDLPVAEGRQARRTAMRLVEKGGRGKHASTRFRVLAIEEGLATLEARPATGRRHQIRLHLASAGWPLAVDSLYGGEEALVRGGVRCARLTLHAWSLRLPAEAPIVCPIPADLSAFLVTP